MGRDGLHRSIHGVNSSTPTPEQTVDMSQSDDEGAVGPDDEGSESHLNRDGKGEQANTHVSSTPQQERHQLSTIRSRAEPSRKKVGLHRS